MGTPEGTLLSRTEGPPDILPVFAKQQAARQKQKLVSSPCHMNNTEHPNGHSVLLVRRKGLEPPTYWFVEWLKVLKCALLSRFLRYCPEKSDHFYRLALFGGAVFNSQVVKIVVKKQIKNLSGYYRRFVVIILLRWLDAKADKRFRYNAKT